MNTYTFTCTSCISRHTAFLREDDTLVSSLPVKRSLCFAGVGIHPNVMPHDPVTQQELDLASTSHNIWVKTQFSLTDKRALCPFKGCWGKRTPTYCLLSVNLKNKAKLGEIPVCLLTKAEVEPVHPEKHLIQCSDLKKINPWEHAPKWKQV